MGGSSKPNLGPAPAAPTPVDIGSVFNNANTYGTQFYGNQLSQLTSAYPQIQNLQLGTIGQLSNNIAANPYSQQSIAAAQQGLGYVPQIANQAGLINQSADQINQSAANIGTTAGQITQTANNLTGVSNNVAQQAANVAGLANPLISTAGNLSNLGSQQTAYGTQALSNAGPTTAENNYLNQTASDLALGTSLNPEEERAASQQAVSAFAHSGLGTGQSAAAADLLNRYAVGQSRLQQRQSAFNTADNTVNQNVLARTNSALGALNQGASAYSSGAGILGQAGNAYNTAGSLYSNQGSLLNTQGNLFGLAGSLYGNQANVYGTQG